MKRPEPMLQILLVDDEPSIRLSVGDALRNAGHTVKTASDGAEALALAGSAYYDVVVTDLRLPKVDGLTVFRKIREQSPSTEVILITAYGTVASAVSALHEGAADFVTKPFDAEQLLHRLAGIDARRLLQKELDAARAQLASQPASTTIIGRSAIMARLYERLETFAASDAPVMISGESGTGKELVARTLHARSARHAKPFIAVNCAAFPETLIEAELFGHERGAFTGAVKRRDGRFKAAHGGTLLLDEVAEIPLPVQAKLLRVLQEGAFEPLGTNQVVQVDVRIVSATHRNLRERIATGKFREDLFYRLNVLDVAVPPLRDRRSDLPILVEHFLRRLIPSGAPVPSLSARAWAALAEYPFPGNVRELEHAIQHAVVLSRGQELDLAHFPAEIAGATAGADGPPGENGFRSLHTAAQEFEREYVVRALRMSCGRRAEAAHLLGISRKNLWEKMRSHEIRDDKDAAADVP